MNKAPVRITRIVRRMRGGSQSQLVQGDDSNFYVAKFLGNPQGNRTLINECVVSHLLSGMNVATPCLRILELPTVLDGGENLYFSVGNRRVAPQGAIHLGSQCPVDPEKTAIFDFLPVRLLPSVSNLTEFATMFVFDKWVGQSDNRQAIFVRERSVTRGISFRAYFVDHGMAFDGDQWHLLDRPLCGLAFQSQIYSSLDLREHIEAAVCQVENISEDTLLTAAEGVPGSWFAEGDHEHLSTLLFKLKQSRAKLRPLIARHLKELASGTQRAIA
jgi:hypothetical protein